MLKKYSDWPDSTKQSQKKYQREKRAKLTCDVSAGIASDFREYCKNHGVSVSGMLSEYVKTVLAAERDKVTKDSGSGEM